MITNTYKFIGSKLWYHIHYVAYNIIYIYIWFHIWQNEIICYIKCITTYPTDLHKRFARNLPCLRRLSSQSVLLAQWIYVLITTIKSPSLWFNILSGVSSIWLRKILPQSGDFSQHTVAAHSDMPECLCVSLMIGRGVLDERLLVHLGRVHRLKGYCPPWPVPQTTHIPLMFSSSPSGRISTVLKCVQEWKGRQGLKGSQHLLVYSLQVVETSAAQAAEQQARVWANPCHDASTWLRDWVTHLTKSASQLLLRWRLWRARV